MEQNNPNPAYHSGEAAEHFQTTEKPTKFRYKSGISGKLTLERVNEITFKVTDGEMSRVPGSYGQWGGYNTTRALAWVIDIGVTSKAWLARCGDKACGPLPFNEAKAAAFAMVKGSPGDYQIKHPVDHRNGLAARLLDQAQG